MDYIPEEKENNISWRRDQKRRQKFISKKKSSVEVIEEMVKEIPDNIGETGPKRSRG